MDGIVKRVALAVLLLAVVGVGGFSDSDVSTQDANDVREQLRRPLDVDRLAGNRSTNYPFVLVEVVNGGTGEHRTAAVDYGALESAIAQEHGIRPNAVASCLRHVKSRRFVFSDPIALKNVWPTYSDAELQEVRTRLDGCTIEQTISEQNTPDSSLNQISRQKHLAPYGYMRSVLHVLLERGARCGASCKPGLVYVE